MTRTELIAALEAATGPSRELDVEIAMLVQHDSVSQLITGIRELAARGRDPLGVPYYTSSLDAALTLVPGDLDWALGSSRVVPTYNAFLFQRDDNSTHAGEAYHAKTPAIALCVAALKAKEGKDGGCCERRHETDRIGAHPLGPAIDQGEI